MISRNVFDIYESLTFYSLHGTMWSWDLLSIENVELQIWEMDLFQSLTKVAKINWNNFHLKMKDEIPETNHILDLFEKASINRVFPSQQEKWKSVKLNNYRDIWWRNMRTLWWKQWKYVLSLGSYYSTTNYWGSLGKCVSYQANYLAG